VGGGGAIVAGLGDAGPLEEELLAFLGAYPAGRPRISRYWIHVAVPHGTDGDRRLGQTDAV
jgi:hypothetical protein